MTIPSSTNRSGPYNGNGVTTAFDFDFKISDETHVHVILADANGAETTLELTADYTVWDVGEDDGGQVIIIPAPATGTTVTLLLDVPFTQNIDLENQGAYSAETVERGLDLALQRTLQLKELVDRSVKFAASDASGDLDQLMADIRWLAERASGLVSLTPVQDQIDAAADEAFSDTAMLTARKADGSLIKRSWTNLKTLLFASPVLTGNPTAPTPSPGDNDTSIATTAFVKTAIDAVLGGVSSAFDTLSEIATALALKAPLASPVFTGNPTAPTPTAGDNDTSIATTAFVKTAIAGVTAGQPIPTSGTMPVGACVFCCYGSTVAIAEGASVAGSLLTLALASVSGPTLTNGGKVQAGTWRNDSGQTMDADGFSNWGYFTRIA